jgi:hypothetical protein
MHRTGQFPTGDFGMSLATRKTCLKRAFVKGVTNVSRERHCAAMSMALYKHSGTVLQSEDEIFDEEYRPGKIATRAGIYRCSGCGREITSEQRKPLPAHDHHEHTERQGAIRWTLIVYADHRPKSTVLSVRVL